MTIQRRHSGSWFKNTHQRGLTLVEILVAVVIISVGLLGVAALHLTSLKNGYDSNNRSRATWLANDIADHIRANSAAAQGNAYNVALGGIPTGDATAISDVRQWQQQINAQLQGQGSIIVAPIGAGTDWVATITIQWNERGTAGTTSLTTQFGI